MKSLCNVITVFYVKSSSNALGVRTFSCGNLLEERKQVLATVNSVNLYLLKSGREVFFYEMNF